MFVYLLYNHFMWLWLEEVRYHVGYEGDGCWNHDENPALVCDTMVISSSTGADWVYLSAGADDGNQCQVEFCPNCLYRWMEPHINLLYAQQMWIIKVLTIIQQQH